MYAIGMTKDEQERSCLVKGNVSGPDGMRFEGEGLIIGRAAFGVLFSALVAVTYTGKRGAAAFMWFFAVFGLPLAVIFLIFGNKVGLFIVFLLTFLFFTYILVKRHYLLKRTTAGLLKDRQT